MPLLNIAAADFNLRQDIVFVFNQLQLDTANVLFLDTPTADLAALHAAGRLDLILVDHNALANRQAGLGAVLAIR
jgi:exopolyphosphatase